MTAKLIFFMAIQIWFACGILARGFTFAAMQHGAPKDDETENRRLSLVAIVFGPPVLLALWATNNFRRGWRWK